MKETIAFVEERKRDKLYTTGGLVSSQLLDGSAGGLVGNI